MVLGIIFEAILGRSFEAKKEARWSLAGFAPGFWARTTTEGGTTSGYSEIGSLKTESRPASKINTDSTPAKIGRSIKNLDIFILD